MVLAPEVEKRKSIGASQFCVIPYHSIGKEHGLLYGIRVKKIIISNSDNRICMGNIIAVMSEHGFVNKKEYQALLHTDLLGV